MTDFPTYIGENRVWYLLDDESILFAKNIPDCTNKSVLDIGSGSGILGIIASYNHASNVIAIDVSDRAIEIGRFNAKLNNCKNINFIKKSIADLHTHNKFDLILFNPPFVPMPKKTHYMLSGYGGQDGLALVYIFFNKLPVLIKNNGSIEMISMSPGDKNISVIERLLLDKYYNTNFQITATDIYGSIAPISVAYRPFVKETNFGKWKKWLEKKNYTHMHYLMINVFPSNSFAYNKILLKPKLEDTPFSGTWKAMYNVISNTKKHA